jgi:protocatechuate 3,4-dioxygenase beta subunit
MRTLAGLALITAWTLATGAAPAGVKMCPPNEPGERLDFGGRILDATGQPVAGVKVFAYHTNIKGEYDRRWLSNRSARLNGTATTGADGAFRFSTIRPAGYPGGQTPAHIHLEITAPGKKTVYHEYWFEDDPIVTAARREDAKRHGIEIVQPVLDASGTWSFTDDIALP